MIGAIGQWLTNRASVQHRIVTLQREIAALQIDNKRLREARDFNRACVGDLHLELAEANEKCAALSSENGRLQAEIDRKSSMPGDHRYWEGRYRDEAAANMALELRIKGMEEKSGPKRDLEKNNDAQAARAMSRSTKAHFVAYQHAVKMILDRIEELGQKNHVTKEDLRKLRQLREDLSAQINRTI